MAAFASSGCRKKAPSDDSTNIGTPDGAVIVVSGNQPVSGDTVVIADGSNRVVLAAPDQVQDQLQDQAEDPSAGLPSWNSLLANFTVAEDSAVAKTLVATELTGPVTFALNAAGTTCDDGTWNPNVFVDGQTGAISGTPRDADVGACQLQVAATGAEGTMTGTITITVSNTNDLPVWVLPLADKSLSDYAPFTTTVQASDADAGQTPTYSLNLAAMSCDESSWSPPLSINASTGVLSGTPRFSGTCTVSVNATSGGNTLASELATFTVIDVPNPPSWTALIGAQTVAEDFALSATAQATDPDAGDTIVYSLDLATSTCDNGAWNPALSINSSTGVLSGTPTNADAVSGTCIIKVDAQSGIDSLTQSFTVTIPNTADVPAWSPNLADFAHVRDQPLTDAYANAVDVDPSDTPVYSLVTSQMTCDDASPAWTVPIGINAATGQLTGTPRYENIGSCTIRIRATSGGDVIEDDVTLTVTDTSAPPTWDTTIGDQSSAEDSPFTATAAATDPDNTESYALDATGTTCDDNGSWSPALAINPTTGQITGTPTNASIGACDIQVIASGGGQSISDTFQLTVTNTDDAPTWVQLIGNFSMGDNVAISKTASATDMDPGAVVAYSLDTSNMTCDDGAWSPALSIHSSTGVLSGHPTSADVGSCTIRVVATSSGVSINQTSTVTIQDATGPAVTVTAGVASPTHLQTIPFTVTFSEGVTGFTLSDVSVSGGTKGNFQQSSAQVYTFDVTAATATVTASVAAGSAQDAASNANFASNTASVVTLQTISVDSSATSIQVGANLQFQATGIYSDSSSTSLTTSVTWTSTTPAVATVTAGGLATGVAGGSINIQATLGGKTGSKALTVNAATLQSIVVTPINPQIGLGGSVQLSATGSYSDNSTQDLTNAVTWASADTSKATVSNTAGSNGFVSAVATGTSSISATLGGVSGNTTVTVTAATLTGIEVSPVNTSAPAGIATQFYATALYSNGTFSDITSSVTWSSSASGVASVSNSSGTKGLVSNVSAGTAEITATLGADDGSTNVTVLAATLQSIAVTPANIDIPIGLQQRYTATGSYSDGSTRDITDDVTWTTSNATHATASNAQGMEGFVTGVANGSVNVTATLGAVSGQTGLDVTTATLTSVAVVPGHVMLSKGVSRWFQAMATFSDATQLDVTSSVVWTSSAPSVAAMGNSNSDRGYFYNLYTGSTTQNLTITANLSGTTGTANVVITIGTLTAMHINPATVTATAGSTTQFRAYGQYNDGASLDITDYVTWTSSDVAVAQVSNATSLHGVVSSLSNGTATITAALGGVSDTSALTVSGGTPASTTEGVGLFASYFTGMNFDTQKGTRIDGTVNYYWGTGNSPLDVGDFFSVRWTGKIEAKYTETMSIRTYSDDGVRLWINNVQIINNWTNHSSTWNQANVAMVAGQKYDVRLEFYENGGFARIELYWTSTSQPLEIIPRRYLYPE